MGKAGDLASLPPSAGWFAAGQLMARVRNDKNNNKRKMINPVDEMKLDAEWLGATPERRKEIEAELAKIEKEAERARTDFLDRGLIG